MQYHVCGYSRQVIPRMCTFILFAWFIISHLSKMLTTVMMYITYTMQYLWKVVFMKTIFKMIKFYLFISQIRIVHIRGITSIATICRLNTSSGGSRGGGGGGCNVVKNVFCQYIYTIYIALQNTDFAVLQNSSKNLVNSIFFPPGRGTGFLPHSPLGTSVLEQWVPIFTIL